MKPASFEYFAPSHSDEAVALMAEYGEDARPLAGGQSLVPLMNMRLVRPKVLIDLGRCSDLAAISQTDDHVVLSAMVRQKAAGESTVVNRHCPLLAATLPHIGSTASRNRGTVCGSLTHADPLSELPCVAMALDARFGIRSARGRREVGANEFFVSALSTCLAPDELLESVRIPYAPANAQCAFREIGNRNHGFAVAGVAVQLETDAHGRCRAARVAAFGVGAVPVRLTIAEQLLKGRALEEALIAQVAEAAVEAIDPFDDLHATAAYRRAATGVILSRMLHDLSPAGDQAMPL